MANNIYGAIALTGGGTGALDAIDGAGLADKDMAYVTVAGITYNYILDDDLNQATSSPSIIRPVSNPGTKDWVLTNIYGLAITAGKTLTLTESLTLNALPVGGLAVATSANTLGSLAVGTTTEILVGGGAGVVPVWTTATGSGAPVRATSPTLVTPLLGTPTSGNLSNCDLATPPAIGETTPNTIRSKNKEIYKTADADSPLTAAQCSATIVSNYGMTDADCTIDLATAAEGLSFVCILPTVRAKFFRLRCPAAQTDKINLLTAGAWVAGADDGYVGVASGYAANATISMFCAKITDGSYEWFAMPVADTWVAG